MIDASISSRARCPARCNVDRHVEFWADELHLADLDKDQVDRDSMHIRPADMTGAVCLYQHSEDDQPWISFAPKKILAWNCLSRPRNDSRRL